MSTHRTSPTRRRRWPWVVGGLALLLLFGLMIGDGNPGRDTTTSPMPLGGPSSLATTAPVGSTPVAPPPVTRVDVSTFTMGTYPVGDGEGEIAPGSYSTQGPSSSSGYTMPCYWSRLKDESGDLGSIISNQIVSGPGRMAVKASDGFIEFSGSCEWVKVTTKR